MSESIRSFIALGIDDAAAERLARVSREVARIHKTLRWLPRENLHLTLAFLGQVPRESVKDTQAAARAAFDGYAGETAKVKGVVFFPRPDRPGTFCLELELSDELLRRMEALTPGLAEAAGYTPGKKKFRPHVTFNRIRRGFKPSLAEKMKQAALFELPEQVKLKNLVQYESILEKKGARYVPLYRLDFPSGLSPDKT